MIRGTSSSNLTLPLPIGLLIDRTVRRWYRISRGRIDVTFETSKSAIDAHRSEIIGSRGRDVRSSASIKLMRVLHPPGNDFAI